MVIKEALRNYKSKTSLGLLTWMTIKALQIKTLPKPGGQLSILNYNHETLEWQPQPPQSMQLFYQTFLKWGADAGMNNHIAENLAAYFEEAGFHTIKVYLLMKFIKKVMKIL